MASLPVHRDFVTFERTLEQITDEWPPLDQAHIDKVKMTPYAAMAEIVIDRVKELADDELHDKVTNLGAKHGARVLGRYCNIAGLVARREGFDKNALIAMLEHDDSFVPLEAIARIQDDLAYRVEVELGIGTHTLHDVHLQSYTHHYTVAQNGALEIPDIEDTINEQAYCLVQGGGKLLEGKSCPALANGVLRPIYHRFIEICAKDPLLFDQTLAKPYPLAAVS